MSLSFLIGAILGSGIAIMAGRAPARRVMAKFQTTRPRNDRR